MSKLVIREDFFRSAQANIAILQRWGYVNADAFLHAIIGKLNAEYPSFAISGYRFAKKSEQRDYGQYGGFIEGNRKGGITPYKKVVVFFTPISSKVGNVVIEQSLMPTICAQMRKDPAFLTDGGYKKIAVLTSKINAKNEIEAAYNKMQLDVSSLITMNFDVLPLVPVKNLSCDAAFGTLAEYLEISGYVQQKVSVNSQTPLMELRDGVLYGDCDPDQLKGEFQKSFCFRYLTAVFAGGRSCKYDLGGILGKVTGRDIQLSNLKAFIDGVNAARLFPAAPALPTEDDAVECEEDVPDMGDIHRPPERLAGTNGQRRYKTQRKIRDYVLEQANYRCNCHDARHVYFQTPEGHNYVEGHHIIPMNRQEAYYRDRSVNLDIPDNLAALCPTCHRQIHWGDRAARLQILGRLFAEKEQSLRALDPSLTLPVLASYYNIALEEAEASALVRSITPAT